MRYKYLIKQIYKYKLYLIKQISLRPLWVDSTAGERFLADHTGVFLADHTGVFLADHTGVFLADHTGVFLADHTGVF